MRISQSDSCPITGTSERLKYFSLGEMPLVNNLADTLEESLTCKKIPLELNYFTESKLTALTTFVDSQSLFSNYLYKSGVNTPYISHSRKMFKDVRKLLQLKDQDLIVDIGGNDGTLLKTFRETSKTSLQYLNIDGSENITQYSKEQGINTLCEFFNEDTPTRVKTLAKVVVSTNVFQHLQDTNSFVRGVKKLLQSDGVWVLEFPYWLHDMKTKQFDQVYHEHMYYYTVTPLVAMMQKHELEVLRIVPQKIHGGTLRLIIGHLGGNQHLKDSSVEVYLKRESKLTPKFYQQWGAKIKQHLVSCESELKYLKGKGKTLVGFAASAKGCVFLNSAGIDCKVLDFIIDDTDIKQGKFMPGTGLEIKGRGDVDFEQIDYILILSHNFSDHIIKSLKDEGYEGKFVVCLPSYKVLS